jgi:hypothetical protein
VIAVAAATAIPATAAFAANDYPVPPPPVVNPDTVTRPRSDPATVASATATKSSTEVLGAQVTRGSIPFTGGDVAGLAAIGAGAVAVGAVMVKRTRRAKA